MDHHPVAAPHEVVRIWRQRQDVRSVHHRVYRDTNGVETGGDRPLITQGLSRWVVLAFTLP